MEKIWKVFPQGTYIKTVIDNSNVKTTISKLFTFVNGTFINEYIRKKGNLKLMRFNDLFFTNDRICVSIESFTLNPLFV